MFHFQWCSGFGLFFGRVFFFLFLIIYSLVRNGSDAESTLRPIRSFWQQFQNVLPKRITANSVILRCLGAAWRRLFRSGVIFRAFVYQILKAIKIRHKGLSCGNRFTFESNRLHDDRLSVTKCTPRLSFSFWSRFSSGRKRVRRVSPDASVLFLFI